MRTYLLCGLLFAQSWVCAEKIDVFFGTDGRHAEGIYYASLDAEAGRLSEAKLVAEVERPGFLALHPDQTRLYAVGAIEGQPAVIAYAVEPDGLLRELNSALIPDGSAAHLSVHPSGRFLLTAQYGGGSVALFPLDADGRLLPFRQIQEHEGASNVDPKRQSKPHPHWVGFSPDGRFAFVPDLGLDQIVIYEVQLDPLGIQPIGHADSIPGGGPRHMRFSIDGRFIFLINEMDLSVSTFAFDPAAGAAELLSTTSALDGATQAEESSNSGSEILVHPSGQYVYAANRGDDSVTAFRVDPENGSLTVIEVEPIRGAWPRSINLSESGKWLLAAGRHSNTVALFEVDTLTGGLQFVKKGVISVPSPTCVLLVE